MESYCTHFTLFCEPYFSYLKISHGKPSKSASIVLFILVTISVTFYDVNAPQIIQSLLHRDFCLSEQPLTISLHLAIMLVFSFLYVLRGNSNFRRWSYLHQWVRLSKRTTHYEYCPSFPWQSQELTWPSGNTEPVLGPYLHCQQSKDSEWDSSYTGSWDVDNGGRASRQSSVDIQCEQGINLCFNTVILKVWFLGFLLFWFFFTSA